MLYDPAANAKRTGAHFVAVVFNSLKSSYAEEALRARPASTPHYIGERARHVGPLIR